MFLITSAAHFTLFPTSVPPPQCPLLFSSFSVSADFAVTQSSAVSPRWRKTSERFESSSCPGQQTLEHHHCPWPWQTGAVPSIWDIKLQKYIFSFTETIQMWGAAGGASLPLFLPCTEVGVCSQLSEGAGVVTCTEGNVLQLCKIACGACLSVPVEPANSIFLISWCSNFQNKLGSIFKYFHCSFLGTGKCPTIHPSLLYRCSRIGNFFFSRVVFMLLLAKSHPSLYLLLDFLWQLKMNLNSLLTLHFSSHSIYLFV